MTLAKTPFRSEDVKERAARKLAKVRSHRHLNDATRPVNPRIKPVHVTKEDPLVRRITNQ
ncbi:hypothetical protein QWY14_03225 [Planococcus sp. N028]|uniref:Uncharacterized protein n=1 Tax=Planococcus shixiaomingii TaxID=3058393 RepID=A0ABT8MYR1_9BACL|nr:MULTISPECIES: hypothetical protein [unclassified Planococcus (in: firmicutes)]MDN7240782.1 hypothetical protein [Planococcus sp. N028]WKA53032.1 hypothetical protein QWY21_10170 [Planococcus sp. N022]